MFISKRIKNIHNRNNLCKNNKQKIYKHEKNKKNKQINK